MRRVSVATVLCALAVAGCSDPFTALKPFSEEGLRSASVGTVAIVNQSATASPERLTRLQDELLARTVRCATGPNKYDMIVNVQSFRSGEQTKGWLLGDSSELKTDISFVDPSNNTVVAIYHLEAGGSGELGERLCRYVFKAG